MNTFLSNMRGPTDPISIAGHRITSIVPITPHPGKRSRPLRRRLLAGQLILTVLADPDVVP